MSKDMKDNLKTFMARYTEDFGETYQMIIVNEENFTQAYVSAYIQIPKEAVITDLFIIEE